MLTLIIKFLNVKTQSIFKPFKNFILKHAQQNIVKNTRLKTY